MQNQSLGPFAEFLERFSRYLPTLAAGLLVLGLGILVGWVVKRAVIRVLIWLRLDRIGGRAGWRAAFGKGDVRQALYNLLGSLAMVLVVLVFLDNALQILGLTVLSRMIDGLVFYVPNLALVALILGIGGTLAGFAARRVEFLFDEEELPRPRLVAKLCKAAIFTVVVAVALWQLNLARQIVLAGFIAIFGAAAIGLAVAFGIGSAGAIRKGWEMVLEKERKKE